MSGLGEAMGEKSTGALKGLVTRLRKELESKETKLDRKEAKEEALTTKLENTFTVISNAGETYTTGYLAGLAEGYWGDKVRPKGIHVPGIAGVLGEFVGVYLTYRGSKAASHVSSLSRGLVMSAIVSGGNRHGSTIRADGKAAAAKGGAGAGVELPKDAKPGDKFAVKQADGTEKVAIVVQQADGSLAATFQGSSSGWRKITAEPQRGDPGRALLSPGRGDRDPDKKRGGARRFPRAR